MTLRRVGYWSLHLVEMVVAMIAGMMVLGPLWTATGLTGNTVGMVLTMALDMTVGMGAWMAVRGHDLRMIGEMSVVMVAPFLLLLMPYGLGLVSGGFVYGVGHVLMMVAMIVLMLVRFGHYSHPSGWAPIVRRAFGN
ncbi:hypothetical protein [Cryptosporangium sp. NPDC048952]|uniref:hypothetical protein n=1 Tax=Cryptosporangium sp. NPDC048952 TaxID=3363961 RepID=UPI0037211A13